MMVATASREFAPLRQEPAYRRVAAEIGARITARELLAGEPLPTELELAGQFVVTRSTVREALDRGDLTGTAARKDCAGVILYAAEKATWMAGEAIQALGGVGYTYDYPTGRLWRDAKLYEIGAGTSEIRRMLIGRELFAETR